MPTGNLREDSIGFTEAQQFSGLSRGSLRKLIRDGRLRASKVGRATKINKRSLEIFVKNRPVQPRLPGFEEAAGQTPSLEKGDQM